MDIETARWLTSPEATAALAAALAETDPSSLAAASRLRAMVPPERAAAVAEQATLRLRARTKFGDRAGDFFWTKTGLEQASRPGVSRRRATRLARVGGAGIVDLGCGCGADAVAFAEAGAAVTGVERDPVTAVLAGANLARVSAVAQVLTGAAEDATGLLTDGAAVFCDPARRTATGRSWRVEDLSPEWPFVLGLLDGSRPAAVKLGPGLATSLIPDAVEAEWISDAGTVVELTLWAGPDSVPGRRSAWVDGHVLERRDSSPAPPVGALGDYLYEPDGAVLRAGLSPVLADQLGAHRVFESVAYLTGDTYRATPFATAFAIEDVMPYSEKVLRAWVRTHGIGVLEIKKRGIDVDPAQLRRRLRPHGTGHATLVLTPTPDGAQALVVRRLVGEIGPVTPGVCRPGTS